MSLMLVVRCVLLPVFILLAVFAAAVFFTEQALHRYAAGRHRGDTTGRGPG